MGKTVFHGATCIVERPLVSVGRKNLDFGNGFYVTGIREQAEHWATRAVNKGLPQYLNVYILEDIPASYRSLIFKEYNLEWLDFIISSRKGEEPWKDYDYIEGGVADDRIINTIEDYLNGDIPADFALKRLSEHQPNNQICILSQRLVEECLYFKSAETLNELAKH